MRWIVGQQTVSSLTGSIVESIEGAGYIHRNRAPQITQEIQIQLRIVVAIAGGDDSPDARPLDPPSLTLCFACLLTPGRIWRTRQIIESGTTHSLRSTIPPRKLNSLLFPLLCWQSPAIQVSNACIEVRGISQPCVVRGHQPESRAIRRPPIGHEHGHVADEQGQIAQCRGRSPHPEEERHPQEVQCELGRVQRLSGIVGFAHRQGEGPMGGHRRVMRRIAHQSVQDGPGRPEEPTRWAEGRLLEVVVGFLGRVPCRPMRD